MFAIQVLFGRQLIQSTMAGFLEVDEVRDYAREMTSAHRAWIRPGSAYRLVINAKDARIHGLTVARRRYHEGSGASVGSDAAGA